MRFVFQCAIGNRQGVLGYRPAQQCLLNNHAIFGWRSRSAKVQDSAYLLFICTI